MRAAPAFQVSLRRFGVWRAAVALLGLLGVAAIAAWGLTREPPLGATASIVAALVAAAITGWAVWLARVPAVNLGWDGQRWQLVRADAVPDESAFGELRVVIDLGPWMLLRFELVAAGSRPRVTWLPVQRRGIEAQWHALRCTVHAPRPAPGADAADGP